MEIPLPDEEMVKLIFLIFKIYILNRGPLYVGIVKKNF